MSITQISKKRKTELDDKWKMIELLRESVENENRNNEITIEATKELKNGMTEQANIMVPGFKDVMKGLREQKKWTFLQKKLYIKCTFLREDFIFTRQKCVLSI